MGENALRIGIDYRILAVGGRWINRGMGRYSQQQLSEVLRIDGDNHYLLLCTEDADTSLILPDIRRAPNVSITRIPARLTAAHDDADRLRAAEAYQRWLAGHHLDVYHATTPFYDMPPVVPNFDVCPLVTTLYDLIPLIFPEHYGLTDEAFGRSYLLATGLLTRADRIIAISESARRDAWTYLGVPLAISDVACPFADGAFRPMDRLEARRLLGPSESRPRIPDRFALVVTADHHSKNLATCLRAFAMMPEERRLLCPLVFGGEMADWTGSVPEMLPALGIERDVIFTGLLSDGQLAALYNLASFVVHPSRYEGFGLPVLEAMQCGTPVITTTASSLPEVSGDAALLVDPEDAAGFARAMETLLVDAPLRAELRERGLRRAAGFNGARLARTTLEAYRSAARAPGRATGSRPRVAVWTPLPPQQSGVADFSAELIEALRRFVDMEIFVDDGATPLTAQLLSCPVHHHSAFERRRRQAPFDLLLYQFGASSFHSYMYEPMQEHPGIVDIHDLSWSQLLFHEAAVSGRLAVFAQDIRIMEGDDALQQFNEAYSAGDGRLDARLQAFMDEHPMLRRVVDRSLAQIVHFPEAKRELEKRYPAARVHVIPMGVADPLRAGRRAAGGDARIAAGIPPGSFVVGVLGIVHPLKRLDTCLRAFAGLPATHPESLLTIVGRAMDAGHLEELSELAQTLGIAGRVRFTGHVSPELFDAHLRACDVVVNLRYPAHGQMSAIIMRAAAAGKPLIVSDIGDWDFIPGDFCWRLRHGDGEVEVLSAQLERLSGDRRLRARMGARARAFYQEEGTLEAMAERYHGLIRAVL